MKLTLLIDSKIDDFVASRVGSLNYPDADEYFELRSALYKEEDGNFLRQNILNLNSDTSALLTHISAMIAALGVTLIVFDESDLTKMFIFAEMISYGFLAIVCVYSLKNRSGPVPFKEDFRSTKVYYERYIKRRYLYIFCSEWVVITTVVFLMTIFVHLVVLIF